MQIQDREWRKQTRQFTDLGGRGQKRRDIRSTLFWGEIIRQTFLKILLKMLQSCNSSLREVCGLVNISGDLSAEYRSNSWLRFVFKPQLDFILFSSLLSRHCTQ